MPNGPRRAYRGWVFLGLGYLYTSCFLGSIRTVSHFNHGQSTLGGNILNTNHLFSILTDFVIFSFFFYALQMVFFCDHKNAHSQSLTSKLQFLTYLFMMRKS